MNADARLGPSWVDSLSRVLGVIGVAVYVDADPCRTGDVDGFGRSLLRAQPAGEDGAVPPGWRPVDETRRDAGREDRVDRDYPAPSACLDFGYPGHRWRCIPARRITKRGGDRFVRR